MRAILVLIGTMQITSYQAVPEQTRPECKDNWDCTTSIGDRLTPTGCAVSQDLLKTGTVKYHDWIYVDGYGYCHVNDTMNKRHTNSVDLFAWTPADEVRLSPRKAKVYALKKAPGYYRRHHGKGPKIGRLGTTLPGVYEVHTRDSSYVVR